jgi:hypothetical protein
VGDLHFQQKATERISQIVNEGTTVIMTGHDIERLSKLCTHGLWIASGEQVFFGEIGETIDKYLSHSAQTGANSMLSANRDPDSIRNLSNKSESTQTNQSSNDPTYTQHFLPEDKEGDDTGPVILLEAGVRSVGKSFTDNIFMNDTVEIMVRYKKEADIPYVMFVVIQDKFGHELMSISSHRVVDPSQFIDNLESGTYKHFIKLPQGLFNQGVFSVSFYFVDEHGEDVTCFKRALFFKVNISEYHFNIFTYKGNFSGSLFPFFDWSSQKES